MNLNVKALETMHETCEQVLALEYVQHNEKLAEQYRGLKHNIDGCCEMLTDLNTCLESLKANGYSQEWFDIVNEGGRFMAICPVDLPKFFGGNHAKTEACTEAIMDTLVDWAKKAWKVLCEIFQFIMKCIKIIMDFWNREIGSNSNSMQQLQAAFKKMLTNIDEAFYGDAQIILHDPDVVNKYVARMVIYLKFLWTNSDRTKKYSFDKFAKPNLDSGEYDQDVLSLLSSARSECGLNGSLEEVGFDVTSRGIEFVNPDSIENITLTLKRPDHPALVKALDDLTEINSHRGDIEATLKKFQTGLKNYQDQLEYIQDTAYATIKSGGRWSSDPRQYTGMIQRIKRLYDFYTAWVQQFAKLSRLVFNDEQVLYKLMNDLRNAKKHGFN